MGETRHSSTSQHCVHFTQGVKAHQVGVECLVAAWVALAEAQEALVGAQAALEDLTLEALQVGALEDLLVRSIRVLLRGEGARLQGPLLKLAGFCVLAAFWCYLHVSTHTLDAPAILVLRPW